MATSGNTNLRFNRNEVIRQALLICRVATEGEEMQPEMITNGAIALNSIIKSWTAQGYHLWKLKEGTLFLEKGKYKYSLNPDGDNATNEYNENMLKWCVPKGSNQIYLQFPNLPSIGEKIAFRLCDREFFWANVTEILDDNGVVIDEFVPECLEACSKVIYYTNKIIRPLKILDARRVDSFGIELIMRNLEREQYNKLTDKTAIGTPVNYYYDPQLKNGFFYVWQAPADGRSMIKFTYEEEFEIFDTSKDEPDFPMEWFEALTWNLAHKLCFHYGLPDNERDRIKIEAKETLTEAKRFDEEVGSVYIQPDLRSVRGAN